MKTKCKRVHYRQYHHLDNRRSLARDQSIFRKIIVGVIALSLSAIPVTGAVAGEGYILMQAEFGLSKMPKFRQLNLAYQDQSGLTNTFDFDPYRSSIVVVPLYSTMRGDTGLFNRLDEEKAERRGSWHPNSKCREVCTGAGAGRRRSVYVRQMSRRV